MSGLWQNDPSPPREPDAMPDVMKQTSPLRIVVLGGTGFVGHHLAAKLAGEGHRVKILTRHREAHRDLLVLPTVEVVTADVYNSEALVAECEGADAVINLVGILNEKGHSGAGFQRAHVEFTRIAANAARKAGVHRFLQMSALGASKDAPSHYQRTKAEAEHFLLTNMAKDLKLTIFQPSVIFGPGDSFLNRFGKLLKIFPVLPLACPQTRFAPVYVCNVVEAYARCLNNPDSYGKRYQLCGPEEFSLLELVQMVRQQLNLKRIILPLPYALAKLQAMILEFFPGKPLSLDNLNSLQVDNICQKGNNGLTALGIHATHLSAVLPDYITASRQRLLDKFRRRARRKPKA